MSFERLNKTIFSEKISSDDFLYSHQYPAIAALCAFIFWMADIQLVAVAAASFLGGYILAFKKDVFPVITLLLSLIISFRNVLAFTNPLTYLLFLPAAAGLITHLIRFKPENPLSFRLAMPLIALTAALFLGGIFAPYTQFYPLGLSHIVTLGPVMLIAYMFFTLYLAPDKNFDYKSYICMIFICLMLAAGLQRVAVKFGFFLGLPFEKDSLGWGNYNFIGYLALFAAPACFYLLIKTRRIIIALLAFSAVIIMAVFSGSDGAVGILIAFTPIMLFFFLKQMPSPDRKIVLTFFGAALIGLCAVGISLSEYTAEILGYLKKHFLHDTGRTPLYKEAWNAFIGNPLFGAGYGFAAKYAIGQNFHSVIFHTLATMGVFGALVYTYYYYERIKILIARNTVFNLFAFIVFSMFTVYSSIDCGEFNIIALFSIILLTVTEFSNKASVCPINFPLKKLSYKLCALNT